MILVCLRLAVHNLMWKSDGGAIQKGTLFVPSLEKISEQLPLSLHKDRPPPHKAEAILFENVVAILHHLGEHTHNRIQLSRFSYSATYS